MTGVVTAWDEQSGRGTARVTWPKGVGTVLLLRRNFRAAALRRGARIGLEPGDE